MVWRTGALGDLVCTLPVVEALRAGARHLTVVGPGRCACLFPGVDRWIDADGLEAGAILAGRAPLSADLGVAWTPAAADALRGAGVGEVLEGTPRPAGEPIGDHLWRPVRALLGPRDRHPKVVAPADRLGAIGAELGGRVVIAPGSGGRTKRWPLARWAEVASAVRRDVIWVGGPQEADEGGWGSPRRDDLGLLDLAALAATCHAWVGPDAGPSHLAAAAGARVGVVFVSTDPAVWAPPGAATFDAEVAPGTLARWADQTASPTNRAARWASP